MGSVHLDPLKIKDRLQKPNLQLSIIPIADIFLIILFFIIFNSRFLFAPGVTIDLPSSEQAQLPGIPTVDVLTLKKNNVLIFHGRTYSPESFVFHYKNKLKSNAFGQIPLLLKVDREVDMQAFIHVSEKAKQAGFTQIQVAAEEMPPAS